MSFATQLRALPGEVLPAVQDWRASLPSACQPVIETVWPCLSVLLSGSPYLFDLATRQLDWFVAALKTEATESFRQILETVRAASLQELDEVGGVLRQAKARVALLAALAEVGRVWTTAEATSALSDFADACLNAALGALILDAKSAGKISLPDDADPAANCGLALFALGKQGGRELNYSSDIDIVAFYDPVPGLLAEPDEANRFYTRITQRLVAIMEERDAGGVVFRTDLRLRPDPGSTPLALGVSAALQYYESRGQNWERAAWIKARVCAGDVKIGNAFLEEITPFIWRKHLDFATIDDIQAIKRQINLARNFSKPTVAGHNVKLGRGGIREIEFFAQTQQLIAGGRDLLLRVKSTSSALQRLAAARWISEEAATELELTYWFLRAVENRLQMLEDEQTHVMPETEAELTVIANLMGFAQLVEFSDAYTKATACVLSHYSALFSQSESLAGDTGDLVFTGGDDDPGTIETLYAMGFTNPSVASATVRRWHYGGYAATRTSTARAHLTGLLPALLKMFAEAGNADEALARFDSFIARLPAGIQLFALLRAHSHLCRLLILFMASAPRLAEEVIHRAHVLDGLIDPTFADDLNQATAVSDKVDAFLSDAETFEDLIDRARLIGQEQKFLISAGLASATIDAHRAGLQFSTLAESLLGRLYRAVRFEFEKQHGKIEGGRTALLAFGKMGSREMTATSDLDFILLYDVATSVEASDGVRPLAPSHYYARLTQRLLAALAAPTAAGVLYEADMRLRPSGNKGPLATPLSGFRSYQLADAWTWEHLALTRARVVFADENMQEDIYQVIDAAISQPRDAAKTIDEVISMRARMAQERKPRHAFDLKLLQGGLTDLEFMAQSAQLLAYTKINRPRAQVSEILARMGELGMIGNADRLIEIHQTYSTVIQAMSACLVNPFRSEDWTDAFRDLLAVMTNTPSFAFLETDMESMKTGVLTAAQNWYETARG